MADKIVVLRDGCVEQIGKPLELYANPDNKFVAGFLGSPSMNFLEAKFDGKDLKIPSLENLKIKKFPKLSKENLKVTIGVRPQDVLFKRSTKGKKIEFVENLGNLSIYHLRLDKNNSLLSESNNKENLPPGETIQITLNERSLYFFDQNSGLRIR